MHSIGMSVKLWRQLFSSALSIPNRRCSEDEISHVLTFWLQKKDVNINKPISWARREWHLDQELAGTVINHMRKDIILTISPVVGRVHFPDHPLTRTSPAGDVVESHEHKIVFSQLANLQHRIDLSVLRNSEVFQNWSWTSWYRRVQQSKP